MDHTQTSPSTPGPAVQSAVRLLLKNRHVAYVALMVVLTLALYGSFVFSGKVLYGSDTLGNLDSRVFYSNALSEYHQFPTWLNPRLGGMPSLDASFGDALYPPSLVMHSLFPVHRAMGYKIVLHVILAGVFFYVLLVAGFGAPPLVGFAGAVLYMFNPQFISLTYSGHEGKMFVTAWVPYVVWRLKALMDKPNLLNSTLMALGIAMCLLTAHVQLTYFMLWGLFAYWVLAMALQWRAHRQVKALMPLTGFFWLAVVLGIGAAFIQFYPTFAFVRDAHSVRGVDRGFEFAASWSLHWPEFFSLWVPEFGNYLGAYWSENAFKLNTEYAGAALVILAVLAVVRRPGAWRILWGAVALFAALYSLGAHTPVFHLAYHLVPGVKRFRACSMMMFWFSFATALLAGMFLLDCTRGAFDELAEAARARWSRGLLIGIGAATAVTLLFSIAPFVAGLAEAMVPADVLDMPASGGRMTRREVMELNVGRNFVPMLWLWWLFAVALLGLTWAVVQRKVKAPVLVWAVLVIGLIDSFRVDLGGGDSQKSFVKAENPRRYFQSEPALESLAGKMQEEPFRVFALAGSMKQNSAGIHGLEDVSGFHDNELRWYREFRGDQRDANYYRELIGTNADGAQVLQRTSNAFLNLANVRYLLVRQGYKLVALPNEKALPRLSFVRNWAVMDTAAVVEALATESYDPATSVALFEQPEDAPAALTVAAAAPPMQTTWETYTPNYRRAKIECPDNGFVRIAEVYYEGWDVRLDGEPVHVYQADCAWMAIVADKGAHVLEMRPKSLYLGKASMVSLPVIIACALYWISLVFLRRKPQSVKAEATDNAG